MLKTTLLLITATVLLGGILIGSTDAHAYLGIDSTDKTVSVNADKVIDASIATNGTVPTDGTAGAFGYGLIYLGADGNADLSNIIVSTTHAGVQDSEAQNDANDPVFHNHYVSLTNNQNDAKCPGLEVVDITFQQPGSTSVSGNTVSLADVPFVFEGTHSLSSAAVSFDASGHVAKAVSFTINPVDATGATSVTDIQAVCINDVSLQDPTDVATHLLISAPRAVVTSDSLASASIAAGEAIPTDGTAGAFGYGLIYLGADGNADLSNIIVSTTHAGVQDSEAQSSASDPIFHNHYVSLTNNQNDAKCPGLEVVDITFQQPGSTSVSGNTVSLADVPFVFEGTHSLSSADVSFDASGHVAKAVSFTINPVDATGATSVTDIQAVCINDVSLIDPLRSAPMCR